MKGRVKNQYSKNQDIGIWKDKDKKKHVELEGRDVDNVEEFVYLGSLMSWDNDCMKDIRHRTRQRGFFKVSGKYGKANISVTRPRQGYCRYV